MHPFFWIDMLFIKIFNTLIAKYAFEKSFEIFQPLYTGANVGECHFWLKLNIGWRNGLVSSGNKPLSEPMLIQIWVAIWHQYDHWATMMS